MSPLIKLAKMLSRELDEPYDNGRDIKEIIKLEAIFFVLHIKTLELSPTKIPIHILSKRGIK